MTSSLKIQIALFAALLLCPAVSNAQVRDAASKILGDYGRAAPAPRTYFVPAAPAASQAPAVARSPESANRAFSYNAQGQAAPCPTAKSAPAPAPQAARQPAPPQAARRYSFEPNYVSPRYYGPSRGWQRGVRDATSKLRGEY